MSDAELGPVEAQMTSRLQTNLTPARMRLDNESHRHNVPPGAESHWNLIIVSEQFAGRRRIERHRAVHDALGADLMKTIHALTMKTMTPAEWEAAGGEVENPAPPCLGGGKTPMG